MTRLDGVFLHKAAGISLRCVEKRKLNAEIHCDETLPFGFRDFDSSGHYRNSSDPSRVREVSQYREFRRRFRASASPALPNSSLLYRCLFGGDW